jgi:hypothetical protein
MPISPTALHWIGVVLACLIYLFIICRIVDGIWDIGLTGILYDVVWSLILRRVLRWLIGFYILIWSGATLVMAGTLFIDPWKSLMWVLPAVLVLRIVVWLFWILEDGSDLTKEGRDAIAKKSGMGKAERFFMWVFHWGPWQGLDPLSEKWREHPVKNSVT